MKKTPPLLISIILIIITLNTSLANFTEFYNPVNYGTPSADELDAFNHINDFRADPQNELYEMFVGQGYGGTKADFDALLNGQTTHTANWWRNNFGSNLATNSMDAFGTVPATLNAQFAALPAAGTLNPYTWSDNIGWAAHQYSVWVENDAGASGAHTVAGAPTLGDRFTEAGSNWTSVGENVARDWPLDVSLMHMGFGIDWGTGIDGIQNPPGHRNSMLSTTFDHIGIGIVDYGWTPGEYTQTQHFARETSTDPVFYGYVTDRNGLEFNNVTVELFDSGGNSLGTTTTDARGAYTIQYNTGLGTPDYAVYTSDYYTWQVSHESNVAFGNSGANYYLDAMIPEPSSVLFIFIASGIMLLKRKRN